MLDLYFKKSIRKMLFYNISPSAIYWIPISLPTHNNLRCSYYDDTRNGPGETQLFLHPHVTIRLNYADESHQIQLNI